MLQYILNMSAIWLLSLIVFDLFLSKESFHSFNRLYLLGTCLMGILLPLWSLQPYSIDYAVNISRPVVAQATVLKESIVAGKAATTVMSMWMLLRFVYIAGVVTFSILLLKDIYLLIRLYLKGTRSKDGVWTIIETHKDHTPFSAFRMVFISSKENYSTEELSMILNHEEQHGHALHFADQLLMQIARIVFWFHPLIHLYYNRLMIIHEYQADKAVNNKPSEYGRFLVEQAVLQSAPALTHSFNRSPIKKRILMLTKKSTGLAKSKTLLSLPLMLVCILCFTKNAFSDDKRKVTGNIVTYRENKFEMKEWANDTTMVQDPVTGEYLMKIAQRPPSPVKLNGNKIYQPEEIDAMPNGMGKPSNEKAGLNSSAIKEYLLDNLIEEFKEMPDGRYYFSMYNIVSDETGKIVYFDFGGVMRNENKGKPIPKELQDKIAKRVAILLNEAPKHTPATVNGKPVPSLINNNDFWNTFVIKDGKITEL